MASVWMLLWIAGVLAAALAAGITEHRRTAQTLRRQAEERRQLAARHSWKYEELPGDAYRVEGPGWVIEPLPGEYDTPRYRWYAEHPRAPRAELAILGRQADDLSQSRFGRALIHLEGTTTERARDGRELHALPQRVELGSTEFRERFVARVHNPNVARRVIDREVEQLLLHWPPAIATPPQRFYPEVHLAIAFNARGLAVELSTDLTHAVALEHLARLGQALASRLRH